MKSIFKKAISVLLITVMVLCSAPLSGFVGLELPEIGGLGKLADSVSDFFEGLTPKAEAATSGYYTYSVTGGEATITYVDTSISGDIIIPSTLGGYPVTIIGNYAFEYCTSLASITIPDSVTIIGSEAFSGCTSLASVTIGNGVTSIGEDAFSECISLESVTIGNGVTSIGSWAFSYCTSLESITIPDSVTSIGNNVFLRCESLTEINVSPENSAYSSDEYGVLFNKNKTELLQYPVGNTRTDYIIPDGVTSICDYAFNGCTNLTSVTISDSVKSIGNEAFVSCDNLESVTIGSGVTSIGTSAFAGCISLTSITIPDSVTSIGDMAFGDCISLASIEISDGVTNLGMGVFGYCTSLESVTIGDSVTSIGSYAFIECNSLTDVYYSGSEEEWNAISILDGNDSLKNANIVFGYGSESDAEKYFIEFYDGNNWLDGGNQTYGEAIVTPELPENKGYTFVGWVDAEGNPMPETVPAYEAAYYTEYIANNYSITLDANGGKFADDTYVFEASVNYNDRLDSIIPEHPTREGYLFCGWVDENGNYVENLPLTMPDYDLSFTAVWEIMKHDVIYDANGGAFTNADGSTISIIEFNDIEYGAEIPVPEYEPVKDGYTFARWAPEAPEAMPDCDIQFVAEWEKIPEPEQAEYKVYISYPNPANPDEIIEKLVITDCAFPGTSVGIAKAGETGLANITYSYDEIIVLAGTDYIEPDYDNRPEPLTVTDGTNRIVVPFKLKEYIVEFNPDGGNFNGSEESTIVCGVFGQNVEVPAEPIRKGYIFAGWDKDVPATFTENVVINAKWQIQIHDAVFVVYDADGSEVERIVVPFEYGDIITAPEYTAPEGYVFNGWNVPAGTTMGEEDMMFTATLSAKNQYSIITLDANSGVFSNGALVWPMRSQVGDPFNAVPANPTRDGFEFIGWTDEEGNATSIPATFPEEDITIYAAWAELYDVTYYDADGTTVFEQFTDAGKEGDEVPVPETVPTKEGAIFAGWVDAEGNAVTVLPAGNVSLYPLWNTNIHTAYFYLSEEDYELGNYWKKVETLCGEKIAFPEDPEIDGYYFDCWDNDATVMGENDLIFIAITEAIEYFVEVYDENGEIINNWIVHWHDEVTEDDLDVFTKEGYTLSWYADEECTIKHTFPVVVEGDTVFYAGFTKNSYIYTFNAREGSFSDGTTVKSYKYSHGDNIEPPEEPTAPVGMEFVCWDAEVPATAESNMTFEAVYQNLEYKVVFMDGNSIISENFGYFYGYKLMLTDFPEGYVADGWKFEDGKYFTDLYSDGEYTVTDDVVLYYDKRDSSDTCYSYLDAQYDNFVYVGLDVIELANGQLTDGYVQPGDWLEYRMTVLSDMYIGNTAPVFVYERDFFDVRVITSTTPSTSETYESYDYEGNIKFTDGSLMNPNHPVAPQNGVLASYNTLTAFPYTNVVTQLGFCEIDAETYSNWDFVKSNLGVTTTETNTNFEMKTDEWITSWYVRVKEGLAEGETGKSFSPEAIWKHNINPSTGKGDTRRLADIYTADSEGIYTSSRTMALRYDVIEHVFLDDTYHTFTIGENPADIPAEPVAGTTNVTTYAELASQYEKFVYVGVDVVEVANGLLTDGYVNAGDWLEYRITILSDMYIGNSNPHIVYEKDFFDVRVITSTTPSTSETYEASDYEGNKKFTDGSLMNPAHPVHPSNGAVQSYNTLTAFPSSKVTTQLGFCEIDADTYSNWDFVKSNLGVTTTVTNTNFEMKTDEWITCWYVRVKEGLADGETGNSFSPEAIWKHNINPSTGKGDSRRLADICTGDSLGTYGSSTNMNLRYSVIQHVLLDDTYHTFTIGASSNSEEVNYNVTWNIDGKKTVESYCVGDKITVPEVPEKKGYVFVGWDAEVPETMPANNLKFNAVYEIVTYNINWCIDGLVMNDSYHYGDTIVKPKSFSKKGYTFVGWTPEIPATMPDYDLTFEAVWQVNSYTVFWDVDGVITEAEYDYNEPIVPIDSPEKEGHIFIGWGNEIPSVMPEYDLYFIAEWEVKKYNVTWVTDSKETTAEYYYGEKIVVPELPEKRGYTIVGWIPEIPDKMPADNLSFEAEYIINTYVLTWNIDGDITEVEYDYNEPISLPDNPEKEGYTFIGWGAEIPSVMPDNDLYFTAEWELNKYSVTWITDGEETIEEVFYGEEIATPELSEKTGYTFAGWTPEVPDTMPAENLVFNAIWTANLYDAVFATNGGSFSDGDSVKRISTAYDSEIVSPGTPSREGYIFSGWAYNGKNIGDDFGVMDTIEGKLFEALWIIDSSATYVVEYHMMNTLGEYDVTPMYFTAGVNQSVSVRPVACSGFVLNEEKSILEGTVNADNSLVLKVYIDRLSYSFNMVVDGETETVSYYYGAMISEPANPVKEGYEFIGWDAEIPETMPAEDVTVTAVFKEKAEENTYAKFTIAKPEKSTLYYGETITLYASVKNAPEGAKIKWYVDGDGVSIKPSANGKTCKVTSTSNGNVVVRATLVDAKGNTIKGSDGKPVADYETIYSEVTFWQVIVNFFRKLFGSAA